MNDPARLAADALARHPRVPLAQAPTPLHEARRLREALGGPGRAPRILLKRDDLTGLAGGGNKARKLEFLLADALAAGATWVVTTGGVQSNHARMTAAAAGSLGLGVTLVLTARTPDPPPQGNLLLDRILGAEIRLVPPPDDPGLVTGPAETAAIEAVVAGLRDRGEVPAVIPLGGSSALGALGYVAAALELADQLGAERPVRAYVAAGSVGTAAGLALGLAIAGLPTRTVAVAVAGPGLASEGRTRALAAEAAARLGVEGPPLELELATAQVGAGYGVATPACLDAIMLLGRTEGILLDPVYTGKAMAGLLADIAAGLLGPEDTVVFLHTGGLPGLFAQADVLAAAGATADPRLRDSSGGRAGR